MAVKDRTIVVPATNVTSIRITATLIPGKPSMKTILESFGEIGKFMDRTMITSKSVSTGPAMNTSSLSTASDQVSMAIARASSAPPPVTTVSAPPAASATAATDKAARVIKALQQEVRALQNRMQASQLDHETQLDKALQQRDYKCEELRLCKEQVASLKKELATAHQRIAIEAAKARILQSQPVMQVPMLIDSSAEEEDTAQDSVDETQQFYASFSNHSNDSSVLVLEPSEIMVPAVAEQAATAETDVTAHPIAECTDAVVVDGAVQPNTEPLRDVLAMTSESDEQQQHPESMLQHALNTLQQFGLDPQLSDVIARMLALQQQVTALTPVDVAVNAEIAHCKAAADVCAQFTDGQLPEDLQPDEGERLIERRIETVRAAAIAEHGASQRIDALKSVYMEMRGRVLQSREQLLQVCCQRKEELSQAAASAQQTWTDVTQLANLPAAREHLQTLCSNTASLQTQATAAETAVTELRAKLQHAEQELAELQQRLQQSESDVQAQRQQIQVSERHVDAHTAAVTRTQEHIVANKAVLQSVQETISDLLTKQEQHLSDGIQRLIDEETDHRAAHSGALLAEFDDQVSSLQLQKRVVQSLRQVIAMDTEMLLKQQHAWTLNMRQSRQQSIQQHQETLQQRERQMNETNLRLEALRSQVKGLNITEVSRSIALTQMTSTLSPQPMDPIAYDAILQGIQDTDALIDAGGAVALLPRSTPVHGSPEFARMLVDVMSPVPLQRSGWTHVDESSEEITSDVTLNFDGDSLADVIKL
eukprot:TRINITY_DN643_c1_g1_i2.p1 TRINITY_DN643_c1_g1~~TRINITY_DN643_c1_g1_i2.p1  ORF type:complete len:870 (-),score=255.07 TRINITY_DN643_c1_g1_i2:275-2572(-)